MAKNENVGETIPPPESWEWQAVVTHLIKELFGRQMMRGTDMPVERVQYQVEQAQTIAAVGQRWGALDDDARAEAWPDIVQAGYESTKELLPVCVRCGDCCRQSSPTLYQDDLELVHSKMIPPQMLVTLRRGEPVRSPFQKGPFHLEDECIKVREQPDSGACVFYDAGESSCGIYENRPIQCRAQACWDATVAEELAEQPKLNREDIFASLEELMTLLEEHDKRCAFDQLRESCEQLAEDNGGDAGRVVEAVAFEDHFRSFVAEQLELPADALDLFFGRSFVEQLKLFGLQVESSQDGSRVITALAAES